ncbi:hypothetical protein PYCC9005_000909 [Savitreella phatthalungensis]
MSDSPVKSGTPIARLGKRRRLDTLRNSSLPSASSPNSSHSGASPLQNRRISIGTTTPVKVNLKSTTQVQTADESLSANSTANNHQEQEGSSHTVSVPSAAAAPATSSTSTVHKASEQVASTPAPDQQYPQPQTATQTHDTSTADVFAGRGQDDDNQRGRQLRNGRQAARIRREPTPDDAETRVIDPKAVRMMDLTRETRQGKKSSRHDDFKKISARRRRGEFRRPDSARAAGEQNIEEPEGATNPARVPTDADDDAAEAENGSDDHDGSDSELSDGSQSDDEDDNDNEEDPDDDEDNNAGEGKSSSMLSMSGPQVRVVNGKLVVDTSSLQVDRAANSARRTAGDRLEYVEENPLEKRVNSSTYARRQASERWDAAATERFFDAVSQWGTDFEMIRHLFPGRTRRQIKSKFVQEERRDPSRVTEAMKRPRNVDLGDYSHATNMTVRPLDDFERELAEMQTEHEREHAEAIATAQTRAEEVKREAVEHKKEKSSSGPAHDKVNEARPSSANQRKTRARGGVQEEVVGTIEDRLLQEKLEQERRAALGSDEDEDDDDDEDE